ncbi:MAG: HAD hydrolase-like protein [Candidatus Woesearchaeota archaeon]|nr:HAD hydrolase-like protein [Candidatus Woesearchaeota archaeon]
MENTFIFDLDDTLIYTEYHYRQAEADAMKYIVTYLKEYALSLVQIFDKFEEIEHENIKKLGYSIERFPTSLKDTFGYFCNEAKKYFSEENLDEIEKIGRTAYECPYDLMPDAKDILDFLTMQNDTMLLLTKGDEEHQMNKVIGNELFNWFDRSSITVSKSDKTPELIREILEGKNMERAYSVGNYFRSDILPALGAGIHGIYIPRGTWSHECNGNTMQLIRDAEEKGMLKTLTGILEIRDKYEELFK